MSRPEAVDMSALRARLSYISTTRDAFEGSLYLHTLGCAFLASDNDTAEETLALENLYQEQAELERVDGHAVLTGLLLVERS
jgi:hypothetical protein